MNIFVTTSNKNWIMIRTLFNKILFQIKNTKKIINKLSSNEELTRLTFLTIVKISKTYPPQKNENKFIYGKLIEMALIDLFSNLYGNNNCIDLDKKHKIGSNYKNDITLIGVDYSIKAKLKKGGDIILINKLNSDKHNMDMNIIVCVIDERKLYIIPNHIIKKEYIKISSGAISLKWSFINKMNKEFPQFIFTFPEVKKEELERLLETNEINIYNILYNEIKI